MLSREDLEKGARSLMFEIKEGEYEVLYNEVNEVLHDLNKIKDINNIKDVEPMTFPFINEDTCLRKDEQSASLSIEEAFAKKEQVLYDKIKIPKVVG